MKKPWFILGLLSLNKLNPLLLEIFLFVFNPRENPIEPLLFILNPFGQF